MSSIADDEEIVEDRFDDQSFDDAPLSDRESNFDEKELREYDNVQQSVDERIHSFLSTIPEESKIGDMPNSELTILSSISRHPSNSNTFNNDDCSSFRAFSVKSSEFISDQKPIDIIQREQESFLRAHGRFILNDPRFNQSNFEKENSWEPSIINHSSCEKTNKARFSQGLPVPDNGDCCLKSDGTCLNAANEAPSESNNGAVSVSTKMFCQNIVNKENITSDVTNKDYDHMLLDMQKLNLSHSWSTPKRILDSSYVTNEPTNPSVSSSGVVQTSTPISLIAKATSRHHDLAKEFHGVSLILPEASSTFDEHSVAETTGSLHLSIRTIQEVLKKQPSDASTESLMKVLEEHRKSRVKARKAHNHLFAPPVSYIKPSLPCTSRNLSSTKSCSSGGIMAGFAVAENALDKTTDMNKTIVPDNEMVSKKMDHGAACNQGKVTCEGELSSRPHSSARSSSSLSTNAMVPCFSQLTSNPTRRSVLYIPQLEVAFGFVAIGDTAVSNVDVTNRTDTSLRIRAKLSHSGPPFTLLDSQILLLDARRTVPLRIEFSPSQIARFYTNLLIAVEGGGGPQMNYRMPVRGLGGAAVVTVKARDDLRISRNGTYILQSCHESTFSFSLTNSGNRRAFSRVVVLCTTESGALEHIPADIRPAPGIVIDRGDSKLVSIRLHSPISSMNSIVSTASTAQQRTASELQVMVYWGEERTRQRLRCFEKLKDISHLCEGIRFTDAFLGEELSFCPPEDHPITKEDVRLFDQKLRMSTIYVCSQLVRLRQSLASSYSTSFERSLQPEDTFCEESTYKVAVPDQTLQ